MSFIAGFIFGLCATKLYWLIRNILFKLKTRKRNLAEPVELKEEDFLTDEEVIKLDFDIESEDIKIVEINEEEMDEWEED